MSVFVSALVIKRRKKIAKIFMAHPGGTQNLGSWFVLQQGITPENCLMQSTINASHEQTWTKKNNFIYSGVPRF